MSAPNPNADELNLIEAARLLVTDSLSLHDAEVLLADAIQRGRLHANVMRWATEQWDGRHQLPGNINRRETFIQRSELEAWRKAQSEPLQAIAYPRV